MGTRDVTGGLGSKPVREGLPTRGVFERQSSLSLWGL